MPQSEVAPLERVLLKHARDAFGSQAVIDRQWRALGYTAAPDYGRAIAEYDEFIDRHDLSHGPVRADEIADRHERRSARVHQIRRGTYTG